MNSRSEISPHVPRSWIHQGHTYRGRQILEAIWSSSYFPPYAKKEVVEALMAKGFSDLIAKKACLMSGNKDLETAEKWIEEHKNDADFNEPVQIGKL